MTSMSNDRLERPADLPTWDHPPLDEVAIAVQFNDIGGFKIEHFGLLAEYFRPVGLRSTEDKATIPPAFELFGKGIVRTPQLQLSAVVVPYPRVWYVSDDKHSLVQVQQDRFIYNWRKVAGAGVYPRLSVVLPEFLKRFEEFTAFLLVHKLPAPAVNQCEVSYFNIIDVREDESYQDAFSRVFSIWNKSILPATKSGGGIVSETSSFSTSLVMNNANGTPAARIHVTAQSAVREGKKAIKLTLIFRGPWISEASENLVQFIARGREAIVRIFDSIISDETHKIWGRQEGDAGAAR